MNIDKECRKLCRAINRVKGIKTIESCCGHEKHPYRIWFKVDSLKYLPDLVYWFDGCHSGHYNWTVSVSTDCGKSPIWFMIEGGTGKNSYEESTEIARLIMEDQEDLRKERKR